MSRREEVSQPHEDVLSVYVHDCEVTMSPPTLKVCWGSGGI